MPRQRREETAKHWASRLAEFENSNLSLAQFCQPIQSQQADVQGYCSFRYCFLRSLLRSEKTVFLALPQNLWVIGSNVSRMEEFGFFVFPR
jgi:hypothetical protein